MEEVDAARLHPRINSREIRGTNKQPLEHLNPIITNNLYVIKREGEALKRVMAISLTSCATRTNTLIL